MDNANSILLNRFFTRNTFKEVIDEGESSAYIAAIRRYIVDSANKTNDECISLSISKERISKRILL